MVLICKWSLALKVGLCVLYLPSWNHYCEIFHTRFQDQRAKCDNPKVWSSVKEVVNQFDVVTSLICPNGMSYLSGMWRRNQQTLATTRHLCFFFYDGSWRITSIIMFTSEEKKKEIEWWSCKRSFTFITLIETSLFPTIYQTSVLLYIYRVLHTF